MEARGHGRKPERIAYMKSALVMFLAGAMTLSLVTTTHGQTQGQNPTKPWKAGGLYTSNGAVLGIFKRSNPDLDQPDLFIFGLPFDFRGYELGYSEIKNHTSFTWAILKGHTRNGDGTVRLRSADPREIGRAHV